MDKPALFTKNFLITTAINFCITVVFYSMLVVIAVYAMDKFHASPGEAGLAVGIFIVGALFARIFTGRSIEQVGRKKTLYIGLIFFLITTIAYFGVTSVEYLYVIRLFHGIAGGISSTAAATIVTNLIPAVQRGEGIGYFGYSTTLATAIGPAAGMYLIQHGYFDIIVSFCVLILIVSCIAAYFLQVTELELTKEQRIEAKGYSLHRFIEFTSLPIAFIGVFMGICYSSIIGFLAAYTQGISLIEAGSLFSLFMQSSLSFPGHFPVACLI